MKFRKAFERQLVDCTGGASGTLLRNTISERKRPGKLTDFLETPKTTNNKPRRLTFPAGGSQLSALHPTKRKQRNHARRASAYHFYHHRPAAVRYDPRAWVTTTWTRRISTGLVNEGVTFTNCHVTAASCAPSRASLFTGYYPAHHRHFEERGSLAAFVDRKARRERLPHRQHRQDAHLSLSHAARF